MDKKAGRKFIFGEEAQKALLEGAEITYRTVTTTYGPRGRNVLAQKPYGMPRITRDGVSVARETYLSDPAPNAGAQLLLEASEKTNQVAGDATSVTVALGYHLMKQGTQAVAAGVHPMVISDTITKDAELMLDELDKLAKPVKKGQLKQVATVSSGDPLIGQLIAEAVEYVGPDGGINAERAPLETVEREYVDGYFLQSGFSAMQEGKKEMLEPMVLVVQKRIASAVDMGDILQRAIEAKGLVQGRDPIKFLIIGNIDATAYIHAVNLINQGLMDAVIVKTPLNYGDMGTQLLEDIAIYTGCDPILESTVLRNIDSDYVGTVGRVVASKNESTLYGDNSGETVQDRIASLKSQIEGEAVDAIAEKLRDRVAKLEGKIALFRIGGATDTAREELSDRIEDAILATRAAASHGVIPGGALAWIALSKLEGISETTRQALRDVFRQLLLNANTKHVQTRRWYQFWLPKLTVDISQVLQAPYGWGYNLRKGDNLVDLVAAGILDPKLAIREAIKNASSFAANILKVDTVIVDEDKEQ